MAAAPSAARPLPLGPLQGIAYDVTPCETQQPEHILGSCRHADMAALHTERHNQALLLVHRALMQSVSPQPCIVIMDATSKAQLPPGIYSNRLPAWLLPSINDTMRSKLRPDLLIIEGICPADLTSLDLSDPTTALDVRRRCKITIVELGYTIEHK